MNHTVETLGTELTFEDRKALREHDWKRRSICKYEDVLDMRIDGMTFDAIGKVLGVTRERIRQVEAKGVEIIRWTVRRKI